MGRKGKCEKGKEDKTKWWKEKMKYGEGDGKKIEIEFWKNEW